GPHAVAVAIPSSLTGALMALRPDQPGDLALHERLGQHPNPFPQYVAVLLREQLADELVKVHPPLGHRPSSVSLLGGEARGEDVRWPFPFLAAASYRISTTSGDTTHARSDGRRTPGSRTATPPDHAAYDRATITSGCACDRDRSLRRTNPGQPASRCLPDG